LPLSLFASKSFVGLTLLTLLLYGALGALLVLLPYVLIKAAGYSSTAAGASVAAAAVGDFVRLADHWKASPAGSDRGCCSPLVPSSLPQGFLLALRIGADADYWKDVASRRDRAGCGSSALPWRRLTNGGARVG